MTARVARRACVASVCAALAALPACRYPTTEVLVDVDTDVDPARTMTIRVRVIEGAGLEGGAEQTWVRGPGGTTTLPGSFSVVPADPARGIALVTVVFDAEVAPLTAGAPRVAFRRVVRFAVAPRTTARVPVFLSAVCAVPVAGCTILTSDTCTLSRRCEEQLMTCGDQGLCVGTDVTPTRSDAGTPPCTPGAEGVCYAGPAGSAGVGICRSGTRTCGADGRWGACTGAVTPRREVCGNAEDDDCDGATDETCPRSCLPTPVAGCGTVVVDEGGVESRFALGEVGATNGSPVQSMIRVNGSFDLDAHEVSVARFRRWWDAGRPTPTEPINYRRGERIVWQGPVVEPVGTGTAPLDACNWSATPGEREAHPINCVDWATAAAFCSWDRGRLPTEAEWEFVARARSVAGLAQPLRRYPWGAAVPVAVAGSGCDRAHFGGCAADDGAQTRRVGGFAASGGVFDLAGNVSEWTADRFAAYTDASCWGNDTRADPLCAGTASAMRAVRGGGYTVASTAAALLACAAREGQAGTYRAASLGFRCLREW